MWVLYTTSCITQSSLEDGQNDCPKHVELTVIINKPLLFHLVGCLRVYYLYQWCTVKKISNDEIYLLIKYIKSVLWRVAKCLSYIEDARRLKVKKLIEAWAIVLSGRRAGWLSVDPSAINEHPHKQLATDKNTSLPPSVTQLSPPQRDQGIRLCIFLTSTLLTHIRCYIDGLSELPYCKPHLKCNSCSGVCKGLVNSDCKTSDTCQDVFCMCSCDISSLTKYHSAE